MVHTRIIGGALLVTLVLSLSFLGYCLRNDDKRGAVPLAVMFVGIACWVLADAMHVLVVNTNGDPMAGGGLLIRVLGIELTVIGFLLLGLSYTGRDHLVSLPTIALLLVKPAVVLAVVLSPFRTELFATVPAAVPLGYEIQPTLPFTIHVLYSYGIALAGVVLLGSVMVRSPSRYRLQGIALFLAAAIPFSVSALFQVGVIPIDLTPVSFTASGLLLTVGAFRLRLLDTIPIARKRVLNEMDDPVVVLDENDRIASCNAAATERFGATGFAVGDSGADLFGAEHLSRLESTGQTELWHGEGENRRQFSITASEVGQHGDSLVATVLVCRDVTDQRRRQRELREREAELKLLKDLQSRVLRHNLRNELNVIRTNAELLTDDETPSAPYEKLIAKTDRLITWSEKARAIERLIEVQETVDCDLTARLKEQLSEFEERYPEVTFECDLVEGLRITAVPQIERGIENLIDNAARHNPGPDPAVDIRTEPAGDQVCLSVSDNGPGIDSEIVDAIVDDDRTALDEGSGFGIWMVYWVVNKSDGEFSFETSEGGTTIELRFDRADNPKPVTEHDSQRAHGSSSG